MKKLMLLVAGLLLCTTLWGQSREEKREARHERRAERNEKYAERIDSMVLQKSFRFSPRTMQREPNGVQRTLTDPSFGVVVWENSIDINIPYIRNKMPPYIPMLLNYTVTLQDNYTAEKIKNGWRVTFSTTLFSSDMYTFEFVIYSPKGDATLNISNTWYNPVRYEGVVMEVY